MLSIQEVRWILRLIKTLVEKKCPVRNICFAWSAGDLDFRNPDALRQAMERGVYSFFSLCQALIGCKLENDVQLIYLHSGSGGKAQPHNEAVAGLVKALRLEHPKFSCKVVEVDHQSVNQESSQPAGDSGCGFGRIAAAIQRSKCSAL